MQMNEITAGTIPWGHLLIIGIAASIIGIILLIHPVIGLVVLVQFLGFYWLITGVLTLVSLIHDRTLWGWRLFAGILGTLAGLAVIQDPLWSAFLVSAVFIILLAVQGFIQGIVHLVHAAYGGGFGAFLVAIISIVFSIFLLVLSNFPVFITATAIALVYLLGFLAVIGGLIAIVISLRDREHHRPLITG